MSTRTKVLFGGALAAAIAAAALFFAGVHSYREDRQESVSVGEKVGAVTPASGGIFTVTHRNAKGEILSVVTGHNALTNEGANDVWATYLAASGRSAGNTWYVGLVSATPSATSTLSNITEISGNGYARQAITWDFGTSRHAKTGNVVFTATAAWASGATYLFITNASSGTSGKMLNYLALSATRQPAANGDTITVSWDGTL